MCAAVPPGVTISVKTRLGIDDLYSYDYFRDFVGTMSESGCRVFHVHARKAWLAGLSPRENREIPPLEHGWVHRLKRDFPALTVVVNGGITSVVEAVEHLRAVDGVMLGRHAYADPYHLVRYQQALFGGDGAPPSRLEVLRAFHGHVARELAQGTHLKHMSRHLLNLFQGEPHARRWRRHLTEQAVRDDAGLEVLETALALVAGGAVPRGTALAARP
jgi:tRNA-dihydrouridine synthase A